MITKIDISIEIDDDDYSADQVYVMVRDEVYEILDHYESFEANVTLTESVE